MADVAYSLASESAVDGDMFWLRAAADEIHGYTRAEEPLLLLPGRSQSFPVLRNCRGLPRYPLSGTPSLVWYVKSDGESTESLEAGDDYQIGSDGSVLRFDAKHIGREIHVRGDAGFGRRETLGFLHAAESSTGADVRIYGSADRTDADDPAAPASLIPNDARGMVIQIGSELMLITSERQERQNEDSETEYYWKADRGIGGTIAASHALNDVAYRVRVPYLLEAAARGIARALRVRDSEPGRGVARPVQVQQGYRLVRTDPLAAFRRDLQRFRR